MQHKLLIGPEPPPAAIVHLAPANLLSFRSALPSTPAARLHPDLRTHLRRATCHRDQKRSGVCLPCRIRWSTRDMASKCRGCHRDDVSVDQKVACAEMRRSLPVVSNDSCPGPGWISVIADGISRCAAWLNRTGLKRVSSVFYGGCVYGWICMPVALARRAPQTDEDC